MLTKDQVASSSIRPIESTEDLGEARLEAIGFIFHGNIPAPEAKRPAAKANSNVLHFARCPKLDKAPAAEAKVWFRTIGIAKQHLDSIVGDGHWKWCKVCVKDVTQKIINER